MLEKLSRNTCISHTKTTMSNSIVARDVDMSECLF